MIVQDNQGVVGGSGKAGIELHTIISDAQGITEGMVSYIAHVDMSVVSAISPALEAAAAKATAFIFILDVVKAGLKTQDRVVEDQILIDLIQGAGYGLEYSTLNELTGVVNAAERIYASDFFSKPYFAYAYGCGSPSTGRLNQVGYFPTADEISKKAQELSTEEYNEYIKFYVDNYKFYTSQLTEYKSLDNLNDFRRYSREEQQRRYEALEARLSQDNMIRYREYEFRSIRTHISAALTVARMEDK